PGGWQWNGAQYVWVPGRYVPRHRHYREWVPAHWARGPRGWVWVQGQWR
ncbi:MAG: YXWGXW repeat-containing protein, partial [Acetobacteraceae bacterium]|nr:YXWGXW repeat-containing protein [Acetobacteraceae bacterium]